MIRQIYRYYCDRCRTVIHVEEHAIWNPHADNALPRPDTQYRLGDVDLCFTCRDQVGAAIKQAMKL